VNQPERREMFPDRHVCMLFDHVSDIPALCAPKLEQIRRANYNWVFISNGDEAPGAGGAAGLLAPDICIDSACLRMREVPISVTSIIGRLRDVADAATASGKRGSVFLIDMSWVLHTPSGIAHLGDFEASLHQLTTTSPVRCVCLYNKRFFPEAVILDVLRTHPYVCAAQGLLCNPHFLPPQAYLSGDPAAQLRSWMATLGPAVPECWIDQAAAVEPAGTSPRSQAKPLATRMPVPNNAEAAVIDIGSSTMPADVSALQYRWKIRCLGNLRIYRQDGTPIRWDTIHGATVKTKTLFAFLLHSATNGASAEEIADLLWPEAHDTVQSLNRLYHTVHCLRMALDPRFSSRHESPYLVCRDHRYYLTLPEGTWVDAPIFEQFCRRGEQLLRANELEDSLACHHVAEKLYSGPLFADIPSKYADNTELDWCWSRRYQLGEIYVKMLTCMARIYRQLGNLEQTVAYAEKALLLQPCFESAHQELIRAFHGLGRRDALDRQYRLCCEVLKRFEARAPSSETRALVQSLVTA